MARRSRTAPPGRFRAPRAGSIRAWLGTVCFLIGAALCLAVLTPLATVLFIPLSERGTAAVLAGVAVCGLIWLGRGGAPRCPICANGVLKPENLGTVQQKLGIVDHPMLRKNSWTQWYRCSQCGYREWDERPDSEP